MWFFSAHVSMFKELGTKLEKHIRLQWSFSEWNILSIKVECFYITENVLYWIGMTDLNEGQFRWSYDQSLMTYKNFYPSSGWGSKGSSSNCVALDNYTAHWLDYYCTKAQYYICESNFCKLVFKLILLN